MTDIPPYASWLNEALLFLRDMKYTPLYPCRLDAVGADLSVDEKKQCIKQARGNGLIESDSGTEIVDEQTGSKELIYDYKLTEKGEEFAASALLERMKGELEAVVDHMQTVHPDSNLAPFDEFDFRLQDSGIIMRTDTVCEVAQVLEEPQEAQRISEVTTKVYNSPVINLTLAKEMARPYLIARLKRTFKEKEQAR